MWHQLKVGLAVAAGLLVLQDCKDLGDEPPVSSQGGGVSFQSNVYPLFTQYGCNNCHSSGTYAWYGSVSATHANLINKPATAGCTNLALVRPDSSTVSVLYMRLSGFNCGDRMPKGGNAIAGGDLQRVKDWIDLGAQNN